MFRQLLVIGSLLLVSAGELAAQDTARVSGCYRFDRAYFKWVGRRPGDATVIRDSADVLRLSPQGLVRHRLLDRSSMLDVHPIPFDADSLTAYRWLGVSHWTFVDSSTLNIAWRNGFYGPVFRLVVSGDSLHGRVRFTTDIAGAEPASEPASAMRIECPT
jgi:hypothetical protein